MTWKDVLLDCWKYYNTDPCAFKSNLDLGPGNGAGGNLHIVLDDGNISDDNIRFCINWIKAKNREGEPLDIAGLALAEKLLKLHWRQRARLYLNYHLYAYGTKPGLAQWLEQSPYKR